MVEKNKKKLQDRENRSIFYQWNLGTRTHKTDKHPSRQQRKKNDRKEIEE